MSQRRRERFWWTASLVSVLSIYASLYFVRAPIEFLRARGLLRLSVAALFAIGAGGVVGWLWQRRPGLREALVFLGFGLALGAAVLLAERPEEKLHFLEYGFLGVLVFHAARARAERLGRGKVNAVLSAVVLAGLAGWGDEGIQALLPNRYYDPRDIVWNLLGSSIVILALSAAEAARARDRAAGK